MSVSQPLLRVNDLVKNFPVKGGLLRRTLGHVHAVDDVSLDVADGEAVKAAVAQGLLDERASVLEALTGIRRAGADIVITYHAKDVARWLSP